MDAIIGLDILRQHSVLTIDFEQRTITFDQVGTLSSSTSFISPHWLVIVPVLIGNHEVRLSVDTGAAYTTLKQEQIQSWDVVGKISVRADSPARFRRLRLRTTAGLPTSTACSRPTARAGTLQPSIPERDRPR